MWYNLDGKSLTDEAVTIDSVVLKVTLIVSLSMSIPMMLELLVQPMSEKNFKFLSSVYFYNISCLMSVVIPNAIILFYAIPHNNIEILGIINNTRFILISWAFLSFMNLEVFDPWSPHLSILLQFLICVYSLPPLFKFYGNANNIAFPMEVIMGYILPILAAFAFCTLYFKWIIFIRNKAMKKEMQTEQYMGNIYTFAYAFTFFGLVSLRWSYPIFVEWNHCNVSFQIVTTIITTVFYTIIFVFQKSALHGGGTIKDQVILIILFSYIFHSIQNKNIYNSCLVSMHVVESHSYYVLRITSTYEGPLSVTFLMKYAILYTLWP